MTTVVQLPQHHRDPQHQYGRGGVGKDADGEEELRWVACCARRDSRRLGKPRMDGLYLLRLMTKMRRRCDRRLGYIQKENVLGRWSSAR